MREPINTEITTMVILRLLLIFFSAKLGKHVYLPNDDKKLFIFALSSSPLFYNLSAPCYSQKSHVFYVKKSALTLNYL